MSTHQEDFDRKYISSSEICQTLGISRPALWSAKKNNKLPEPILVGSANLCLWLRTEVESIIAAWRDELNNRRITAEQ